MSLTEAMKYDDGKIPYHLVSPHFLDEMCKVLAYGEKKYAAHNWMVGNGFKYSRVFRAAIGHLYSFWRGEDLDEETGLHHLAHAACCIMFLLHFVLNKDTFHKDDRPNWSTGEYSASNC